MSEWDNKAPMADMGRPGGVQVLIDKTQPTWRMWVNVDGACRLRIYDIRPETFQIDTNEVDHGRD